jgi:hypothetical protein
MKIVQIISSTVTATRTLPTACIIDTTSHAVQTLQRWQELHPGEDWREYVAPSYDPATQREGEYVLGAVVMREVLAKSAEEIEAENAPLLEAKRNELWQDANDYNTQYISGAALSMLTIGVMQGKPKALAIMGWISTLWNEHYYPQKALITVDSPPYDFSVVGPIPYSVPELTSEVFGG